MLRSGLECGGLHQKVSTTNHASSTRSKLGTLNQHGFPPGISPTIKQVPSLEGLLSLLSPHQADLDIEAQSQQGYCTVAKLGTQSVVG